MLDLDEPLRGRVPLADAGQHRQDHVVPGADDAAARRRSCSMMSRIAGRVQAHRGAGQAAGGRPGAADRDGVPAAVAAADARGPPVERRWPGGDVDRAGIRRAQRAASAGATPWR